MVVALNGLQASTGQFEVGSNVSTGYVDWHMAGEAPTTDYQVRATSDQAGVLSIYAGGNTLLGRFSTLGITVPALTETVSNPPSSSNAPCTVGQHTWDVNYEYRCVASNTWKRAALSSW
jgi:hypothetical protein